MSAHKEDYQLIPAQLICFLSSAITLIQAIIIGGHVADVLIKFTDALFITGTTLLSVKLARDGDEMPAAGFILLAIGWGVLFASTDFYTQIAHFSASPTEDLCGARRMPRKSGRGSSQR